MSRSSRFIFHILGLVVIFTNFTAAAHSSQLKVTLDHGGILVGRHMTSLHGRHIRAFLGVPYAQPPVGELRFKSPVPYGSWSGERLAIQDSDICIQKDVFVEATETSGSEDCLYLNVYTPEEPQIKGPLPVMVWFHGGAFLCGAGVSTSHPPQYLLDRDIIFVSANYRLGALGFLSSETLDCPGNFAFKDQTEVLKWVQENIAAFGGDSSKVTLFGVSAGGASVTYHLISEKSKGLFHQVIAQSGTFYNSWAQPSFKGVAARKARRIAQIVGCDKNMDNWTRILECLRTKSAANLTEALSDFYEWSIDPMIPLTPVLEPEHAEAFMSYSTILEDRGSVPLMIGYTSEEALFRTADIVNKPQLLKEFQEQYQRIMPALVGYNEFSPQEQTAVTKAIVDFYFRNGLNFNKFDFKNFTDMGSDAWFITGVDEHVQSRLSVKNSAPTYLYVFDHKGSSSHVELFSKSDEFYGTSHDDDILYIFPLAEKYFVTRSPTKRDREMRNIMLDLWTNFASFGNPTPNNGLAKWLPVQSYPPKFMRIGSKIETDPLLLFGKGQYPLSRINFWRNTFSTSKSTISDHGEL